MKGAYFYLVEIMVLRTDLHTATAITDAKWDLFGIDGRVKEYQVANQHSWFKYKTVRDIGIEANIRDHQATTSESNNTPFSIQQSSNSSSSED